MELFFLTNFERTKTGSFEKTGSLRQQTAGDKTATYHGEPNTVNCKTPRVIAKIKFSGIFLRSC